MPAVSRRSKLIGNLKGQGHRPRALTRRMNAVASTVVTVTGMTCSHCVHAVESEIGRLGGVSDVQVDLDTGSVTISGDPLPGTDALRKAVDDAGYELVG
jgi:copper chaperone